MIKNLIFSCLGAFALVSLAGCASDEPRTTSTSTTTEETTVRPADPTSTTTTEETTVRPANQ